MRGALTPPTGRSGRLIRKGDCEIPTESPLLDRGTLQRETVSRTEILAVDCSIPSLDMNLAVQLDLQFGPAFLDFVLLTEAGM